MNRKLILIIGIVFLLTGIYLSIFQYEPHFYTPFSIGMFLVLLVVYDLIFDKSIFEKWSLKNYILFSFLLLIVCIIIDRLGISLGYWSYQYETFFDEIIKYIFEWAVALLYFMILFMIGSEVFQKFKINKNFSFILSLLIFVIAIGFITEYINSFSNSWTVLKMPVTNFRIGNYFIVFQTLGYSLMAIIPFLIYKFINKLK